MDSALLHFWGSAAHQGRCSLSWLPWCSALVEFALWWVQVCAESSAVIRPRFLAAALLLFFPCSGCALFWVPCHPSGRHCSRSSWFWNLLLWPSPSLRICSSRGCWRGLPGPASPWLQLSISSAWVTLALETQWIWQELQDRAGSVCPVPPSVTGHSQGCPSTECWGLSVAGASLALTESSVKQERN